MMKRFVMAVVALAVAVAAWAASTPLLTAVLVTGAGTSFQGTPTQGYKTYQLVGTTVAGTGTVAISVQGSNNNSNWDSIGTITVIATTAGVSDSFTSADRYQFLRGNVTTINGTGTTASLTMGY